MIPGNFDSSENISSETRVLAFRSRDNKIHNLVTKMMIIDDGDSASKKKCFFHIIIQNFLTIKNKKKRRKYLMMITEWKVTSTKMKKNNNNLVKYLDQNGYPFLTNVYYVLLFIPVLSQILPCPNEFESKMKFCLLPFSFSSFLKPNVVVEKHSKHI